MSGTVCSYFVSNLCGLFQKPMTYPVLFTIVMPPLLQHAIYIPYVLPSVACVSSIGLGILAIASLWSLYSRQNSPEMNLALRKTFDWFSALTFSRYGLFSAMSVAGSLALYIFGRDDSYFQKKVCATPTPGPSGPSGLSDPVGTDPCVMALDEARLVGCSVALGAVSFLAALILAYRDRDGVKARSESATGSSCCHSGHSGHSGRDGATAGYAPF